MKEYKCEICGVRVKSKTPMIHCGQLMTEVKDGSD